MTKLIRRGLWIIAGLISFIALGLAFLAFVRVPVDLTSRKDVIETIASRVLERQVFIDDSISVSTSLRPVFSIKGLRIGNPPGFDETTFSRMDTARLQVAILPLFRLKIHVDDFSVNGLGLYLQEKDNAVNWTFAGPADNTPQDSQKASKREWKSLTLTSDSLVVSNLDFKNIEVSFRTGNQAPVSFKVNWCKGSAREGEPFELEMEGSLIDTPFSASVQVGSLMEFLDHNRSWTKFRTEIAGAVFSLEGNADLNPAGRHLEMRAGVQGKNLKNLNRLLRLDLPPVPSYRVSGLLSLTRDRVELREMVISVSESRLNGQMTIERQGIPQVDLQLTSPLVKIDDFIFENWSARDTDQEEAPGTEPAQPDDPDRPAMETAADLLAPETLKKIELRAKISAEQVLSGKDRLGSGSLDARLEKGRITIDPLTLNLPGGSLSYAVSLKPDPDKSNAWLRAKVENFDISYLVHRVAKDSDMGGRFNLDMALETNASTLEEILANGNGHLDFSVRPKNIKAGIIDLWAVNLVMAAVARSDKNQSQIECLVGRWSMKDGYLTPDTFVIDTSRMRICGSGWADFRKEEVSLKVAPVPKKPAFFSLATPIGIKGRFADFSLGISPGGVVGTTLRFITSPIHVPIAHMAGFRLPKDAADICDQPLGQENRPEKPPAGCRGFYK
ncbi:MAG: AsmA family protein [Desulfobacterales bacterium]|nr:AsmA family protein [Desulfobacterales bacterium]